MSTFADEPTQQHTSYVPFAQQSPKPGLTNDKTESQLSRMWRSRPVRMPQSQGGNAKVAGVCEGIGIRFQIDPVLIRLVFVVFGFLGAGIGAYLLAWLIMPRYSVPVSPLEAIRIPGHPKDRTNGWWLLIFFFLFSGFFVSSTTDFFSSLITYFLLGAMWWGLYIRQPTPPLGLLSNNTFPAQDSTMNNNDPRPDLSHYTAAEGYSAPFAQQYPTTPSWDPLANTYNSWDIQPNNVTPLPPKKRRIWPWIIGGLAIAGSGWLLFVGLIGVTMAPIHFEDESSGVGEVSVAPTNDQLIDTYSSGIGEMDINLTNLTPLDEERTISISSGIGEVNVTLPDNVPVNLNCSSGVGSTYCNIENRNEGLSGETLNININSGIGDVDVKYADQRSAD